MPGLLCRHITQRFLALLEVRGKLVSMATVSGSVSPSTRGSILIGFTQTECCRLGILFFSPENWHVYEHMATKISKVT